MWNIIEKYDTSVRGVLDKILTKTKFKVKALEAICK